MYSPQYAIQDNPAENKKIIQDYPFATVVFLLKDEPQSFHLPLLLEGDRLIGHIARVNPAWKVLNGTNALFIFHGPHHYISPDYYGNDKNVPTWNYISVQVRGKVIIREDEAFLKKALVELSKKYDANFDIQKNISQHEKLLEAIVGIEVEIKDVFGKFKLAQSKPVSERQNVISALEKIDSSQAREVADAMRRTI